MTVIVAGLFELSKQQNFIYNMKDKDQRIVELQISEYKNEKDYIDDIGRFSLDHDFVLISLNENVLQKLTRINNNNIKARMIVYERGQIKIEYFSKIRGWYQLRLKKDQELFNAIKFKVD